MSEMPKWNKWVDDEQVALTHSLITLGKIQELIVSVANEINDTKSWELLPAETKKFLVALYKAMSRNETKLVKLYNFQGSQLQLLINFDNVMTSLLANERPHPLDETEPP